MKDPDPLYVPVKKCGRGHVIPRNGDVVDGVAVKRPQLACRVCAVAAGGAVQPKKARLRPGEKTEEQTTLLDPDVAIFIGRRGE